MLRAAIYCRVSTTEQQRGFSLDGQYADCRAYCQRMGYMVSRAFREVGSGRNLERPTFQRLIRLAMRGSFDVVVVWRRDRFGRHALGNAFFESILKEAKDRLESIQTGAREDSSYTRFVDRVMDAVDELEAARIAERCELGRLQAARSGKWPHAPPFGFLKDKASKTIVPDPAATAGLVQLFQACADGWRLRELAALAGTDHPTVLRRLRNPAYMGQAVFTGITIEVPAIVPAELWRQAQAALDERRRNKLQAGFSVRPSASASAPKSGPTPP